MCSWLSYRNDISQLHLPWWINLFWQIQIGSKFENMDVEGSKIEALEGAADTIKEYKPILAIAFSIFWIIFSAFQNVFTDCDQTIE